MSVPGFPRQSSAPRAQQDRIDDQQDFIHKPMFEQRRCQRGATPEDEVRAVLRLDAANALDDVRSKALERAFRKRKISFATGTRFETLTRELGPQRGAEEISHQLIVIYSALIAQVEQYRGSVISFSGDAMLSATVIDG